MRSKLQIYTTEKIISLLVGNLYNPFADLKGINILFAIQNKILILFGKVIR